MPFEIVDLKARLDGVAAVPICPFRVKDESIDEDGFREQIAHLVESGVDSIVPCGNTMEFFSLTLSEIERLNVLTFEVAKGRIPIIVGIGHDIRTAVGLARAAEAAGADAVMIHQPNQPFVSRSGIVDYVTEIARSIDIGVVLYIRRELLGPADYHRLFALPNMVGVKHATNDLQYVSRLIRETRDHDVAWICGSAEGWAPFYHVAGARGFTSGLANVFPRLTLEMRDALRSGDLAAAMNVWQKIEPFESMRAKEASAFNVAVVKEALNLVGRNGGVVRKPASGLGAEDQRVLRDMLASWGIELAKPSAEAGR